VPEEHIETAVVAVDWPARADLYLPADWQRATDKFHFDDALIFVSIRIAIGRDTFNVRVLLDKDGLDDADIVRRAQQRAHVMLCAAAQGTKAWAAE
jgi:hypothetical protein